MSDAQENLPNLKGFYTSNFILISRTTLYFIGARQNWARNTQKDIPIQFSVIIGTDFQDEHWRLGSKFENHRENIYLAKLDEEGQNQKEIPQKGSHLKGLLIPSLQK